jgi:hypothetical protein
MFFFVGVPIIGAVLTGSSAASSARSRPAALPASRVVDQREPAAGRRGGLLALLLVGVMGIGARAAAAASGAAVRSSGAAGRRTGRRRWGFGGGGGGGFSSGGGGDFGGGGASGDLVTMNRLLRIARHRWLDERDVRRALGPEALERIGRVAASEKRHSGEIRVCVEAGTAAVVPVARRDGARARVTMFGKLRVWDTERNNGVLIYLLLAERRIEIVADRGLNRRVSEAQWQSLLATMRDAFHAGTLRARTDRRGRRRGRAASRSISRSLPGSSTRTSFPMNPW